MAHRNNNINNKDRVMNRGAWTAEEDRKLAEYVEIHGSKRWEKIAAGSGVKRCGKSCRLRWLNYLRPDIKRGNISDDEEEMIIRLHKLLGNRWSLIAGRLPGRTDNEIKNYWNSRLSKRMKENVLETSGEKQENDPPKAWGDGNEGSQLDANEFFDFSIDESCGLEWVNKFLQLDQP